MLKPLAPCGFLCTCYSFIICLVISFVNIYKSHFLSTNYSFATLFDADRQKIIKASYFYAHLINAQKRTAYAERVENQKKDTIGKILLLGDFCNVKRNPWGKQVRSLLYSGKPDIAKRFLYSKQGKLRKFAILNAEFPCFRNSALIPAKVGSVAIIPLPTPPRRRWGQTCPALWERSVYSVHNRRGSHGGNTR